MKNTYNTPALTVHGNVEKITQEGGTVYPTDVPKGIPGEAYPLS
jgi:hypothetical protein